MSVIPTCTSHKLDFVTVTFGEELGLLQLQARSFALFIPDQLVNNIFIIVNEADSQDAYAAIVENIAPLYGAHAPKVHVLQRSEVAGEHTFLHRGWISQQVLKLMAAHHVGSDDYVILDTKNHFIQPVTHRDFFADNHKLKHRCVNLMFGKRSKWVSWFLPPKRKKLSRRFRGSMQYFGLNPAEFAETSVPKTTPFPMNTKLVRDLINHTEEKEGEPFPAWFEWYFEATEFYLLQSYAAFRGLGFHDLYEPAKSGVLALYPEAKNRLSQLGQTLERVENDSSYFCLGVHRKLAACLSYQQKQLLTDFWSRRGLIEEDQHFDTLVGDLAHDAIKPKKGASDPGQLPEVRP